MTDVFGWCGIDAIAGDESRLDEREPIVANYVETKESKECSLADAFNVIEHLVALDDMELLEQMNSAKVVKEKSPCVLTVKGVLALARRMGHTSLAGNMGRFEWFDVDHCRNQNVEMAEAGGIIRKLNVGM
ncbi:hypothetical protein MLD38_021645 [Melastoma candidum]|uniref:Uncharacterized protein n=1 Tax=Melastoma candidum TaxID=119954 RepID=A0ACB9QGS9_9MYRT|nr:hypothetical protein MLD38_021645 [Melastoma candidum]